MRKPPKLLRVNNFLFDLSTKCGSNSVMRSVLYDRDLKTGSDLKPGTYWNYYKRSSVDRILPGHISVKVVRNPYHRAVSSFTHYGRASRSKDLSFVEWPRRVKKLCDLYYPSTSFYTDNEALIRILFPDISSRLFEHFYLQTNRDELKFDHVIKLENYNSEIKKINELYETTFKDIDKNQNVSPKALASVREDYSMTKFRNYWRRVPPNYDIFYNEESIQLTNDVYGQDVHNFGYECK